MSDRELEDLRDQFAVLAGVVLAHYRSGDKRRAGELGATTFRAALGLLPPLQGEEVEERAAIREVDGGMSRDEAERAALRDCLPMRRG